MANLLSCPTKDGQPFLMTIAKRSWLASLPCALGGTRTSNHLIRRELHGRLAPGNTSSELLRRRQWYAVIVSVTRPGRAKFWPAWLTRRSHAGGKNTVDARLTLDPRFDTSVGTMSMIMRRVRLGDPATGGADGLSGLLREVGVGAPRFPLRTVGAWVNDGHDTGSVSDVESSHPLLWRFYDGPT